MKLEPPDDTNSGFQGLTGLFSLALAKLRKGATLRLPLPRQIRTLALG